MVKRNTMKKKAITICFILSFLISSLSFFFFQANVLATNDLESKHSTINDQDNLYDSVPYWFNTSLYDPDDLTRDFESGLLSIEKEGSFGIKENFTLLNDFNNNYWDNLTEFNPRFKNGSYSDGVFYSSSVSFNYDYGFHPSTNYNETIWNQVFTSPDPGCMSHNYQPEDGGYNSSYSVNGNLTMYNEFPNEKYWEFWNSYNYSYDPLYTTSTFNRYNYVSNASVQSGNGEYISGDEDDLKYGDSQYFKSKSVDYLGDEILYIDFDFSNDYNWNDLDGDYFLFFHANDTMNFRDKNHQDLWNGNEAWGVLLTDIDDYIYIYDERASSFSIQIDFLFLLDPKLISQLNYQVESMVPSHENATLYRGTYDFTGLETEEGYYYGSAKFNDETIGTTGTDIDWVDNDYSSTNCVAEIIDEVGGHKNVLQLHDQNAAGKCIIYHDYGNTIADRTVEFWVGGSDVTISEWFYFYMTESDAPRVYIRFFGNDIYNYDSGGTVLIKSNILVNDTFVHTKLVLDDSANQYICYVNGENCGTFNYRSNSTTGIDEFKIFTKDTESNYKVYLNGWGDPADSDYSDGYNLNPYRIKDIWDEMFSSLYCAHDSHIKITSSVNSHDDVLELYDGTGAKDDSRDEVGGEISFTDQTSGSIELWSSLTDTTERLSIQIYDSATRAIYIKNEADKLQYYYGGVWHDATGGGTSNNTWYHIRIDFDTSTDSYDFYLNGVLLDSDIPFENISNGLDKINIFTYMTNTGYILYIDAIGFSWDPSYDIGDNLYPDCDFVFEDGFFDNSHPPYGDLNNLNGNYTILNSTKFVSSNNYLGNWSFYDDLDDSNPEGWNVNEPAGTDLRVISGLDGHDKIIRFQDNDTGTYVSMNDKYLFARTMGTIEFYVRTTDPNKGFEIDVRDGTGTTCIDFEIEANNFRYYDSSSHDIMSCSADTWYHIKMSWDVADDWHLWIDGVSKDGGSGYNFRGAPTEMDRLYLSTRTPETGYNVYIDAIDYSWASGYYDGRNKNTLPAFPSILNLTIKMQFDVPPTYSNDTIDYFRLYYSYNTSINYQGINFSIWNFDTSQYDIINNSEINDNFYDLFFDINSSYYNSTGRFIIKFDSVNSTSSFQIYLDKLKIEFKWTKTGGNIEASLTKSIVFDFLNYYDSFDNYLKLYRFDYIFNYRFTNTSNHARSAKFNSQNLNTDGSWHTADFYDIYDSSSGDGTINLEFLISNGILEIRTFQYSMWFGCVNLTGGRRILQQIFAVEFPNEGDLSEYIKKNGMFLININYSFSTEADGYDYANTYGRHNKLEIHYAFKADGAWYYDMDSTNSSITKNRLINITDIMNGLGLSDFEDFAITFVMIGNASQITVFNVSLWDTRAVVPAFLNFTFDHEFTRDYLLNYFELLYDWNTTAYTLINFSIYDFQNNTYKLLKSDINTEGDSLYSFVSYLFNYYQDSDNKTYVWIISDYNYSTAFTLNLSINFNYRTSIFVSHKLTFDERGVWRYRFVLTSSGGEYSTEWVYFDVIEPVPNFQAVSKSDYITNWILMSNDTASNIVTRFSDDLMGNQWELTGVPSRYVWYEVHPSGDSWVDLDNPGTNHGSDTILKIQSHLHDYRTYIEDIHDPEDESDYFIDNITGRPKSNFRFYGINGGEYGNLHFTTDFDENTITWNNKPAEGGQIGGSILLGSGWRQFSNIPYTNPGRYVFTHSGVPYSWQDFYSKESGSNKPYFRHYVSKNYHDTSSGYFYMQTDTDETLSIISSIFSTTQAHANDFVLIDCQTLNSDLDVIFLKNGAVVKTLPLVRDNTNYYRRSIEVLIDEDISFDQIKISGQFSDKEYFKCYDIKIQGYEFEEQENIVQFGVAPDSSACVFVTSGENTLKIYDNGILKLEKTIILTYDEVYIEEYVGLVLETVYFSYYDVNNEPLGFNYFKVFVNYTIDNRTILNEQLFDNFLFVDDESTINFNVYDTFNILIASIEEPETTFIKIVLNIYSLKIKNEAVEPVSYVLKNPESSIEKSSNIFPDEIIEFKISSGNYIFDYINGEDNALRSLNFTLNDNKIVVINSTYYQLYVACFNFDGLGLDTDWVRLYINNLRKDFGFNTMKYEWTRFVVLDYFNASLADETVYTKAYTEYNIYVQVYNLILNNNYSHSIYIEITRPDVDISVKQVIPSQSGINYRFLPKVDYIISYYHINGTKIGDKRITLDSNNQIVSFGFYSEEVPPVPIDEIVKYENSMFLDIIVIILCFTIVIAAILYFYRKLYKKNKQQQQYIYNQNINKKKLKIDGLFGKTKNFGK